MLPGRLGRPAHLFEGGKQRRWLRPAPAQPDHLAGQFDGLLGFAAHPGQPTQICEREGLDPALPVSAADCLGTVGRCCRCADIAPEHSDGSRRGVYQRRPCPVALAGLLEQAQGLLSQSHPPVELALNRGHALLAPDNPCLKEAVAELRGHGTGLGEPVGSAITFVSHDCDVPGDP